MSVREHERMFRVADRATVRPQSRRRQAYTLVEILVVIGIIVVLIALLLPALEATNRRARSNNCQNRLRQICMAYKKAQANVGSQLRAENLEELLRPMLDGNEVVWQCPDNLQSSEVSFGFSQRMHRLHVHDSTKIVGLDYAKPVAEVVGLPHDDDWNTNVRPRHTGEVNVVFYDTHSEGVSSDDIDPNSCVSQIRFWTPTVDLKNLPEECKSEVQFQTDPNYDPNGNTDGTTGPGETTGGEPYSKEPCYDPDVGFPEIAEYSILVHASNGVEYEIPCDPGNPNIQMIEESSTKFEFLVEDLLTNPDWDWDYHLRFERYENGYVHVWCKSNTGHGYAWSLLDENGDIVQPFDHQSVSYEWSNIDEPIPPQPCPF